MNNNGQNIFLKAIRNEHVPSAADRYPFNLPIVRNLKTLEFSKSVTYIVGENGSGKSTLLEAIANLLGLNAEGGSKNFNFRTKETHSSLYEELRAVRVDLSYRNAFFFRAESFYNVVEDGTLQPTTYNDCYIYRDMLAFVNNKDLVIKELFSE